MQTKHTPGPWIAAEQFDGNESLGIAVSAGREEIVRIHDIGREGFANAALIAAAPDLLLHLQRLVRAIDRAPANFADGLADEARAAIARATGA